MNTKAPVSFLKLVGALYVAQAAVGFAVGFIYPWLSFFGVI